MKDNHISPIEAVESISRIAERPLTGENISFDTATMPFSVDSFVLKLFNLREDQAERINVHNETDGLHVYIRLKPVPCRCDACGNMTGKVKDYRIRKITHSVITTTPCFIDYDQRRMRCTECGKTFVEPNPFAFPGEKVSAVTVYNVLRDCSSPHETFKAIAERYHISPSTVLRIFDSHVNIPRRKLPRYLVVDETYAFHTAVSDYVFVMMDYETMDIVDVLPSRKKADLDAYFQKIPLKEREKVKIVSSDMWNTYRDMTHRWFPNAVHSCDSFHLKMELSRCVQKVRIRVMNQHRLHKKTSKPAEKMTPEEEIEFRRHVRSYYLLKKFGTWMLYKRPSDDIFDPNRKKKYNRVFNEYLNYHDIYYRMLETDKELAEAVALQEQLYLFFRKSNIKTAPKALSELIYSFSSSTVKEMSSFASTLCQWRASIISSFTPIEGDEESYEIDDSLPNAQKEIITGYLEGHKARKRRRINSSVIENRNKLIKDIKHCSSGYSNWHRFRNKVLLCLNSETTFFLEPQPTSREWINEKKKRTKKD